MHIFQSSSETSSAGDRLGDLVQLFGLVSEKNCEKFAAKAKKESLLFGQVLVSDVPIEQPDLRKIVECQSLIRERLVSMEQAALLFEKSVGAKSLQEASSQLDFDVFSAKRTSLLGGLLLDAKFATEDHLKFGLDQQVQSILPIGRILVSVGLLPEDLLSATVQAQTLIRLGRIGRESAIKALLDLKIKYFKPKAKRKEQTFYQRAQDRTYPRLEQILASGNMISNADLTNAMEKNLLENKPMETILLESAYIDQEILDAAREIEKLVRSDSLDYEQTKEVLNLLKQGRSFNEALLEAREPTQESIDVLTLASLLKKFGCINNAELAVAFDRAQHNSEILTRVLLLTGIVDTDNLRKAEECLFLIQTQALSVDHAQKAFELSQSKVISIEEAIRQLQDNNASETVIREDPGAIKDSDTKFDEVKWQECWRTAMDAIAQKDLTSGRMLLESLRVVAGKSHASYYINCLDAIAETYVQDQNYELAERYYAFALDARLENFEIDSLTCAKGMNAMGKICYFQKRYTEAEKYVKEYVRICSKRLGANHSDVACGWQNIATIYQAQGRFNYAEHAYKRALKGCIETIGENHPTTIKVKNSYANLLLQIDRIKEAEKLFPTADGIITGTWRSIDEYLGENNTEI